jgi:hypothetical protein
MDIYVLGVNAIQPKSDIQSAYAGEDIFPPLVVSTNSGILQAGQFRNFNSITGNDHVLLSGYSYLESVLFTPIRYYDDGSAGGSGDVAVSPGN